MKPTFKVAAWELKRNLKNKSFIISLFLTPLIFAFFIIVPSLFNSEDETETVTLFVQDEINVFDEFEATISETPQIHWNLTLSDLDEQAILKQIENEDNMAYIAFTRESLSEGTVTVYTSDDLKGQFAQQMYVIKDFMKGKQIEQLDLTEEEKTIIHEPFLVAVETAKEKEEATSKETGETAEASIEKIVPGLFAGIILFSIVISGMMIFQSASQEKKDKIAEIILSSITARDLMQGKIIGYFGLGLIQVGVWLTLALPVLLWRIDMPILQHLLTPRLILLLLIAILGYLIFASLFVGLGATLEDVSSAGNFQGLVLMLPFISFIFIGPVISDPNGMVAKVGSYFPFTSPSLLLVRLTILDEWPVGELIISITILLITVYFMMKLSGKIFQTGILMYGKNATIKEIWRWLRA